MSGLSRRSTLIAGAVTAAALGCLPREVRALAGSRRPFRLAAGGGVAAVIVDPALPAWVERAAQHLRDDVRRIVGRSPPALAAGDGPRLLVSVAASAWLRSNVGAAPAGATPSGAEAFLIRAIAPNLCVIVGADAEGARRGIYTFCDRYLGVDPTRLFTGIEPQRRSELHWEHVAIEAPSPPVRLRGWFLNDEDLLTEWLPSSGRRRIDYPYYSQVIAPEAFEQVLETLLRLGMNAVVPASFVDIRNPPEKMLLDQAAARGLWLHQHHVEPVGVSAFGFNNVFRDRGQAPPPFSYHSSRAELERVWGDSIERWSAYERVIWSLGHRGVADRPLWLAAPGVPRDDASVGRIISEAIAFQRRTILTNTRGGMPVLTTSLWAEGSALMAGGHLRIPDDVIVMFADNGPGFRLQRDFYDRARSTQGKAGIYYHHQIWSSGPHLVQATPPARTSAVIADALATGADQFVLINVGNVREFVPGLTLTAALLTDAEPAPNARHLLRACARWFGSEAAVEAAGLYHRFFGAYSLDPAAGRPVFLDGLVRQRGLDLLVEIVRRSDDGTPSEVAGDREWAQRHLGDMGQVALSETERATFLSRQRAGFADLERRARAFAATMTEDRRRWVEANLIAQAMIMNGLLAWIDALERAAASLKAGVPTDAVPALTDAEAAMERAIAGRAIGARGRFATWYRGDRKMNLPDMLHRTRTTRATLDHRAASSPAGRGVVGQ